MNCRRDISMYTNEPATRHSKNSWCAVFLTKSSSSNRCWKSFVWASLTAIKSFQHRHRHSLCWNFNSNQNRHQIKTQLFAALFRVSYFAKSINFVCNSIDCKVPHQRKLKLKKIGPLYSTEFPCETDAPNQ